jgi:GxxExxY protein
MSSEPGRQRGPGSGNTRVAQTGCSPRAQSEGATNGSAVRSQTAMNYLPVAPQTELVATDVIGAAIEVHRHLGPGFLEKIYQEALCLELDARRIAFERERAISVVYRGMPIPGQRIDLIVAGQVVVELKAATRIDLASEAKVISYLRTTGLRLGLLLNFNRPTMREGVKRIVC